MSQRTLNDGHLLEAIVPPHPAPSFPPPSQSARIQLHFKISFSVSQNGCPRCLNLLLLETLPTNSGGGEHLFRDQVCSVDKHIHNNIETTEITRFVFLPSGCCLFSSIFFQCWGMEPGASSRRSCSSHFEATTMSECPSTLTKASSPGAETGSRRGRVDVALIRGSPDSESFFLTREAWVPVHLPVSWLGPELCDLRLDSLTSTPDL